MFRLWVACCRLVITAVFAVACASAAVAYVTFGQGFSSKWGDDPQFGTGAVVTWGFMLDGTPADPALPAYSELAGTSQISQLRASVDAAYGAGSFDVAIANALGTWSAVANIAFVGPVGDSGLPAGQQGATNPNIRIGAFHAVPNSGFSYVGAIGYGPPGIITPANDFPESGDIFFNLDAGFQIATGIEDVTPLNGSLGNDVENLFLHELGHAAIGLGHPPWAGESPDQRVMYVGDFQNPSAPPCCETVNHQLHPDDVAGAEYVYGIRGDYNRDRRVGAADFILWRKTFGQIVTRGTAADGNVDGMVDDADYDAWLAHFGNAALIGFGEQSWPAAAAIPEPSTLLLCAVACMICCARSRSTRLAAVIAKCGLITAAAFCDVRHPRRDRRRSRPSRNR